MHNGAVKKLDEVRYISSFRNNLISLSRLDSNNNGWRVDDEILKVIHGSKVMMKGRKYEGYYLLVRSSTRDGALGASGSLVRDGAPRAGGSDTRWETREDNKQYCMMKFLLP